MRLNNWKPSEPSTPPIPREAGVMHVQSSLYPRSADSSGSGGVQTNTIIFIVVGVVCLLIIMAGFYLVGHSHIASKLAASVHSPHAQNSPIIHPPSPQHKRNKHERWKIWKKWRRTNSPELPTVAVSPSTPVSPSPISPPSPTFPARAVTYPSIISRPSQARRVTNLSVTTSFSHSHITQEALNDFRVSAYDLDGDLETEMLNSARDDVWPGLPLAVDECCRELSIRESLEARGNAVHCLAVDGSVRDYVALIPTVQRKGSDYEACQSIVSVGVGFAGEVLETVEGGKG